MVGVNFFGNFDLASLSIWLFWIFFAFLVYYLQTENMREGYPLEDDDGKSLKGTSLFPVPGDKTFVLPHKRGKVTVPSGQHPDRKKLKLARTSDGAGFPHVPTGDALVDGVGPASWAPRRDVPELDGHGHAKIKPMGDSDDFHISGGRDPRGMPVIGSDDTKAGTVKDIWVDAPEALIRYLEIELPGDAGTRLVPMTMVRMKPRYVWVQSIPSTRFADVPTTKKPAEITLLEEEKVMAFYAGGRMYA